MTSFPRLFHWRCFFLSFCQRRTAIPSPPRRHVAIERRSDPGRATSASERSVSGAPVTMSCRGQGCGQWHVVQDVRRTAPAGPGRTHSMPPRSRRNEVCRIGTMVTPSRRRNLRQSAITSPCFMTCNRLQIRAAGSAVVELGRTETLADHGPPKWQDRPTKNRRWTVPAGLSSRSIPEPRRRRSDGTIVLQSNHRLKSYERHVPAFLAKWAAEAPDRVWLAQRRGPARDWLKVTYAEAKRQVDAVTQALLDRGFGPDKPVMILSSNSIEFALLIDGRHAGARAAGAGVAGLFGDEPGPRQAALRLRPHQARPGVRAERRDLCAARWTTSISRACCWSMSTRRRPRCSRCRGASWSRPSRPTPWRDRSSRSSPRPSASSCSPRAAPACPRR